MDKPKKTGLGVLVGAVILIALIFLASSFVLMQLVNVVLGHYDIKLLDLGVAMAINAILWIYGGVMGQISSKS
jgi:hypothetical protein